MFKFFKSYVPFIITPDTRVGTVLRVHPGPRSHSQVPYLVILGFNSPEYFGTFLIENDTVITTKKRIFRYDAPEYATYHRERFEYVDTRPDLYFTI